MAKKTFNPFKLAGSYIGAITFWWLFLLVIMVLSGIGAAITIGSSIGFLEALTTSLGFASQGFDIMILLITLGVIVLGFFVGYGFHLLYRLNKAMKIIIWILLAIIWLVPLIGFGISQIQESLRTSPTIIVSTG